jgi:hypothetical protein
MSLDKAQAANTLLDDIDTIGKIEINYKRNKKQDNTERLDEAARQFVYEDCRNEYWNPKEYSFLYGTALWDEASEAQRILLNQLYWVAYYAQIISAEIATIFFNQTSAAGLYGMENFRTICDMLDLESSQERSHIAAFKKVAEAVEFELFGERFFTYPMRGPYAETMICGQTSVIKSFWKSIQLRFFGLLSSGNAFIATQYFLIRGVRTLNGKIVQHQLSQYYLKHPDQENAPIPSKISYYHFMDESYHFNSSTIISHDVIKSLKPPTSFERMVCNMAVRGCQRDHYHFSTLVNGIFWHDPSGFQLVYRLLRSKVFGMNDSQARDMIRRCFTEDNLGIERAYQTHRTAVDSYRAYLADLDFVSGPNREMSLMSKSTKEGYLKQTRRAFRSFNLI